MTIRFGAGGLGGELTWPPPPKKKMTVVWLPAGGQTGNFSPKSGQKWPNFPARAKGARGIPQRAYNSLQIGSNSRKNGSKIASEVSIVAQKRPYRLKNAKKDPKVRAVTISSYNGWWMSAKVQWMCAVKNQWLCACRLNDCVPTLMIVCCSKNNGILMSTQSLRSAHNH